MHPARSLENASLISKIRVTIFWKFVKKERNDFEPRHPKLPVTKTHGASWVLFRFMAELIEYI